VVAYPVKERGGLLGWDPLAELWVDERSLKFAEQLLGDHELKLAVAAGAEDLD
jgi:hypothetical protein